jgi:hypothetical protein
MCYCLFSSFAFNHRHYVDTSIIFKKFRLDKRFVLKYCNVHRVFLCFVEFWSRTFRHINDDKTTQTRRDFVNNWLTFRHQSFFTFCVLVRSSDLFLAWSWLILKYDLTINSILIESCNVRISFVILWTWRSNLWCYMNYAFFTWLYSTKTWNEIEFDERRLKINSSRRVALILRDRFRKNDANWNFSK